MSVLEKFNNKIKNAPRLLKGAMLATVATIGITLTTAQEAQAQEMCTVTDSNGVPVINPETGETVPPEPCGNDGGDQPGTPNTGGAVTGTNTNQNQNNADASSDANATNGGNSFKGGNNYSLQGAMANVANANAPRAINECVNTYAKGLSIGNPYLLSFAFNNSRSEAVRLNINLPEHKVDGTPNFKETAAGSGVYQISQKSILPSRMAVMPEAQRSAYEVALSSWQNAANLSNDEAENREKAAGVFNCTLNKLDEKLISIKATYSGAVDLENARSAGAANVQEIENSGNVAVAKIKGQADVLKQRVIERGQTEREVLDALAPSIVHCTNGQLEFQTSTRREESWNGSSTLVTSSVPVPQTVERTKAHHNCDPDKLIETLNSGVNTDNDQLNTALHNFFAPSSP